MTDLKGLGKRDSQSHPSGLAPTAHEAGRNAEPSAAARSRVVLVSTELRAFHTDTILNEGRHEHVWKVTLFFKADPFRDARSLKASLDALLRDWQGRDLPDALWATENLAEAIARLHGNADCLGARLERPDGCGAEVWL